MHELRSHAVPFSGEPPGILHGEAVVQICTFEIGSALVGPKFGTASGPFVVADAYRRKFGGDHIDDVRAALAAYEERIVWRRD